MKIQDQQIQVSEVLRMLDARLDNITLQYNYAKADNRKMQSEAMAEAKWQIAELKMQIADFCIDHIQTK